MTTADEQLAGVSTAIAVFCQHERLVASAWTESPNQYPGGRDVRVTAYWCPTCRRTVNP